MDKHIHVIDTNYVGACFGSYTLFRTLSEGTGHSASTENSRQTENKDKIKILIL